MEPQLIKKEPLGKDFFINVSSHHTFGTDAVVLSHFANAKKDDDMVDLGTGCGIIPFLMLRDKLLKRAVGVDISEEAIFLARKTANELNLDKFEDNTNFNEFLMREKMFEYKLYSNKEKMMKSINDEIFSKMQIELSCKTQDNYELLHMNHN